MVNTMNSNKSGLKKIAPLAFAGLATLFGQNVYAQESEEPQVTTPVPPLESSSEFSPQNQDVFSQKGEQETTNNDTTLQDILNATEYEPLDSAEEVFAVMGMPSEYSDRSHAQELGITQSMFGLQQTFKLDETTMALYNELYEMITIDNRIDSLETDREFYTHLGNLIGKDLSGEPTAQSDHVMELVSLYHYFLEKDELERTDINTYWTEELKNLYQDMLKDMNAERFNIRRDSENPDQSPYDVIVEKQELIFSDVYDRLAPYFQNTVEFVEKRNGEYGFVLRDDAQPSTGTVSLLDGSNQSYQNNQRAQESTGPQGTQQPQTQEQTQGQPQQSYTPDSQVDSTLEMRATSVLSMNRVELQRYLVEVPYETKREVIEDYIGVDSEDGLTPEYFSDVSEFQEDHNMRIQDGTISRDNIDRMTELAIQENFDKYSHILSSYNQQQDE
jgi:hypothetical protein